MNKTSFYNSIRTDLFKGSLSVKQFDGIETLLTVFDASCVTDMRWRGYMLATVFHETAGTMQPIEEYGKGNAYDYGKKLKMSRKSYTVPDKLYYGRGYVQLTWYENYANMGKILGLPLLEQPELLLSSPISARVMIEGMTKGKSKFGDFTGKCLEDYFNASKTDPINARRIINGLDKAQLIAGYYDKFYKAIIT